MLLNCGVGEDSWESLGLQGNPTSAFSKIAVLGVHWKDWCWSWNSNTLASHAKNWLTRKHPDAGKDCRREEKGTTEDEMVGWHHRLNGHEFGWNLGVGDGQGGLVCYGSWGHKESDTTERLNWMFHCVYVPQLSYPLVCWWTSRLLPCPGYYKQCSNEHWGTCISFSSGFLRLSSCYLLLKNYKVSGKKKIQMP